MITTHVVTRNNAATIRACLDSVAPLGKVLVADLGSTDDTVAACEDAGATVVHVNSGVDYSKVRNDVVETTATDWQFWLEPWESLRGAEQVMYAARQGGDAYNVYNVQGDLLTKTTRLWRKSSGLRFVRPVYESLEPDVARPLVQAVVSGAGGRDQSEVMTVLDAWGKSSPHATDVEYYRACTFLAAGRYDQFLSHATNFLFRAGVSTASVLTNYYVAIVKMHVKKKPAEAVQHVSFCLAQQPTMAEFWCLLGDAFARLGQWHRASGFYDNAMVMGSRRKHDDQFPIEIAKYKEYPEKMLGRCREVIAKMHGSEQNV